MQPKEYMVVRVDGDYAYLWDLSGTCMDDLFIALALLPVGVDVGTKLHWESWEYTIIE